MGQRRTVLAAMVLAAVLAGCGSDEPTPSGSATEPSPSPTSTPTPTPSPTSAPTVVVPVYYLVDTRSGSHNPFSSPSLIRMCGREFIIARASA